MGGYRVHLLRPPLRMGIERALILVRGCQVVPRIGPVTALDWPIQLAVALLATESPVGGQVGLLGNAAVLHRLCSEFGRAPFCTLGTGPQTSDQ